jgi:hypothetical protein
MADKLDARKKKKIRNGATRGNRCYYYRHYGCIMCIPSWPCKSAEKNVIFWSEKWVKHIVLVYNAHPLLQNKESM